MNGRFLLVAAMAALALRAINGYGQVTIDGAGSTFAYPLYSSWGSVEGYGEGTPSAPLGSFRLLGSRVLFRTGASSRYPHVRGRGNATRTGP
jgi:hypothetical protein